MKPIATEIYAEKANYGRIVNVHMRLETSPGRFSYGKPVVFEVAEDEFADMGPPMLAMNPQQAQLLIDSLWQVGFRPTQGKQSEGQVAAIEKHLADMRAITFAQLNTPKP